MGLLVFLLIIINEVEEEACIHYFWLNTEIKSALNQLQTEFKKRFAEYWILMMYRAICN